ncbi:hypothetical protein KEJ51_07370, partial [Candidatus Bathyarchaeota archaeon]|nr:hypothetical protein [Candidatus Bathyarchaeota archaeon]
RGGSQIQARLPFRAKDDRIGELVRRVIDALEIIDKDLISASIVKDLEEWMNRIKAACSASGTELAKKIIDYIVDRNVSRECDASSEKKIKELLTKGLDFAWRYSESHEGRKHDLAEKLLVKELGAALQAEIGARRSVES